MKRERLLLFTLAAINFTHIVDFMIMMPLGPQLMRLFDISPQQFSALVSTYTFSAGVSSFIGAFVLDRFDRKKTLMIAYVGFVIGTFACALAPNYQLLLSARIVTGAFGGLLSALILSIIGDVIPEFRRATAIGIVMGAFSVASVVGVPFGLFIANQYSWHAPFIFLGILSTAILGLIVVAMPNYVRTWYSDIPHPSPIKVLTNLAQNGNQLSALWFTIMLVLGHFTIIPFLSPYMVANVGFSESDLTYIYLLGGAVTIFTSPDDRQAGGSNRQASRVHDVCAVDSDTGVYIDESSQDRAATGADGHDDILRDFQRTLGTGDDNDNFDGDAAESRQFHEH